MPQVFCSDSHTWVGLRSLEEQVDWAAHATFDLLRIQQIVPWTVRLAVQDMSAITLLRAPSLARWKKGLGEREKREYHARQLGSFVVLQCLPSPNQLPRAIEMEKFVCGLMVCPEA